MVPSGASEGTRSMIRGAVSPSVSHVISKASSTITIDLELGLMMSAAASLALPMASSIIFDEIPMVVSFSMESLQGNLRSSNVLNTISR
jgi:hypothetical protein